MSNTQYYSIAVLSVPQFCFVPCGRFSTRGARIYHAFHAVTLVHISPRGLSTSIQERPSLIACIATVNVVYHLAKKPAHSDQSTKHQTDSM
jgi:hypothetical protein